MFLIFVIVSACLEGTCNSYSRTSGKQCRVLELMPNFGCVFYWFLYLVYTHTHTHVHVCMCVCVCVCVCVVSLSLSLSVYLRRGERGVLFMKSCMLRNLHGVILFVSLCVCVLVCFGL